MAEGKHIVLTSASARWADPISAGVEIRVLECVVSTAEWSVGEPEARQADTDISFPLLTALVSDAMQDDLHDDSLYLPPCYADATKPEDVYRFEDSILAREQVSNVWAMMFVHIGRTRLYKGGHCPVMLINVTSRPFPMS